MKFKVTFKSPDAVYQSTVDAASDAAHHIIDDEERDQAMSDIRTDLMDFSDKWVRYGEYITIEFDTDNKTATVIPN